MEMNQEEMQIDDIFIYEKKIMNVCKIKRAPRNTHVPSTQQITHLKFTVFIFFHPPPHF